MIKIHSIVGVAFVHLLFFLTCDGELFTRHDDLFLVCGEQHFAPVFASHLQPPTLGLHHAGSCEDQKDFGLLTRDSWTSQTCPVMKTNQSSILWKRSSNFRATLLWCFSKCSLFYPFSCHLSPINPGAARKFNYSCRPISHKIYFLKTYSTEASSNHHRPSSDTGWDQ